MEFETIVKDLKINVKFEKQKRMKHLLIRVLDKENIHIKAGQYFDVMDAKIFIEKKQDWIYTKLNELEKITIEDDEFMYFGKIEKKDIYKLHDEDSVNKFYKVKAAEYINFLVDKFSKKMQLYPTKVSFRKNKRTWGTCNSKNELRFNFLLMKYPLEITEYVVIHELAHIKHKNHSKDFWGLVEIYCKDYKRREKLFKTFL
ncbi:MAG: YgjP-like metallopeptidase domain-containing protein [Sulfurovum sp.]